MTRLPKTTKIENEINNGWLTIWFNSPENRNALSEELTSDLIGTLQAVKDDRSIRGITIQGRGKILSLIHI